MIYLWIALALIAGLAFGYLIPLVLTKRHAVRTRITAQQLLADAKKEAETRKKEALVEAKDEVHRLRSETDRELRERRTEIQRLEKRVTQKEETLDRRLDNLEKRERNITNKEQELTRQKERADQLVLDTRKELERVSMLTVDEAKQILLKDVEEEYLVDIACHVEEMAVLILEKENKIREVLADLDDKVAKGIIQINTPAAEEIQDHIQ